MKLRYLSLIILSVFFISSVSMSEGIHCAFAEEEEDFVETLSHYTMGVIHEYDGRVTSAIAEFEKAVEIDPESYVIHLKLGIDYARMGLLAQAIYELKLASQYNSEDLQSHYLLALVYSARKEFDKATEEYEIILKSYAESDPQNIEIYGYLGQLYYSQKKYSEAIDQFEKFLELEPDNADVMYLLGSLYLELGERFKAVEFYSKSIIINPDHDGSLNSLGYIYAEDGVRLDEAKQLIEKALKIDPSNGAYFDSLGWVYFKKKMYSEALENLQLANTKMKDPVIYEHLGDVYYEMNQMSEAKRYWELSLELLPNQERIIHKLSQIKSLQAMHVSQ